MDMLLKQTNQQTEAKIHTKCTVSLLCYKRLPTVPAFAFFTFHSLVLFCAVNKMNDCIYLLMDVDKDVTATEYTHTYID